MTPAGTLSERPPSSRPRAARGTLVLGQSGGVTAAMNASLAGAMDEARRQPAIGDVYGAVNGILGVLGEEFVDLRRQPASVRTHLRNTPSAVLGTCRHRPTEDELGRVLAIFRRHDVRYFCYIGGNDSADTSHRIAERAQQEGYELFVVGIPKTIDNDLPLTDHCPGYGSIARFIALAARDAGRDTESMGAIHPIKIVEVMGRNAGWVAAAAALGKECDADAPQLIYVPERPFDEERFLDDIQQTYARLGYCVAVMTENVRRPDGKRLGVDRPSYVDPFGHPYYDGPAAYLTRLVGEQLGLRARFDKPGTIQRMSMVAASRTDLDEAYLAGQMAVRHAAAGTTDQMVTLVRESDQPYRCGTGLAPLAAIANVERRLPDEFVDPSGRCVTPAFLDYARPLIGGPLPKYVRIDRVGPRAAQARRAAGRDS